MSNPNRDPNRDFCPSVPALLAAGARAWTLGVSALHLGVSAWHLGVSALVLGLAATPVHALPEDQQQPIRVTADAAIQENNTVTYKGNVVVVQGTIKINADQVLIYHDKGKLQRAVATGKPVHFQQQPDNKGGPMTGHANTVIYYNTDERVELIDNALVERDQSTLKGQRIEYLMPNQVLRADGAVQNTQPGRVEMVLQPNQSKDEQKPAAAGGQGQDGAAPATTAPAAAAPAVTTPASAPPAAGTPAPGSR